MEREKVIINQKVSGLCSIIEEIFSSFQPLEHPNLHPNVFFECVLGCKHLDRLKTEYTKIKKGLM